MTGFMHNVLQWKIVHRASWALIFIITKYDDRIFAEQV